MLAHHASHPIHPQVGHDVERSTVPNFLGNPLPDTVTPTTLSTNGSRDILKRNRNSFLPFYKIFDFTST